MTDVKLQRLRLELDGHASTLLLVGDKFAEGGRYVQIEVPRFYSAGWNWLDWDDQYDRLTEEWVARFDAVRPEPVSQTDSPDHAAARSHSAT